MSGQSHSKRPENWLWTSFTTFIAALSVINLVSDADLIRLQENIATWFTSYENLVETLFAILVGWISVDGFMVEATEQHIVLLFSLTSAAMIRGVLSVPRNTAFRGLSEADQMLVMKEPAGVIEDYAAPWVLSLIYTLIFVVLAGILQPSLSLAACALIASSILLRYAVLRNPTIARKRRFKQIRQQLVYIAGLSLIFVFANFMAIQLVGV